MTRFASLLLFALLTTAGLAQDEDRANHSWDLYQNAYGRALESELPATIVMNMQFRSIGTEGEVQILSSLAVDFDAALMRNRTCQDGFLFLDSVYRDGLLTTWMPYLGEVSTVSSSEEQIVEVAEQALANPSSMAEALEDASLRYLGPVDFGVVSGELLELELPPSQGFDYPGLSQIILGPDGSFRGNVMDSAGETTVARMDGMMRIGDRRYPLGFTTFRLEDGEPIFENRVRFWQMRFDVELPETLFELDVAAEPGAHERLMAQRELLMERLSEVSEELRQADLGSDEAMSLIDEQRELLDDLKELTPLATVPCPGTL